VRNSERKRAAAAVEVPGELAEAVGLPVHRLAGGEVLAEVGVHVARAVPGIRVRLAGRILVDALLRLEALEGAGIDVLEVIGEIVDVIDLA
jgi:hypothetical protein